MMINKFRMETYIPVRKIRAITDLNNDKVNKIIKIRQKNRPPV